LVNEFAVGFLIIKLAGVIVRVWPETISKHHPLPVLFEPGLGFMVYG